MRNACKDSFSRPKVRFTDALPSDTIFSTKAATIFKCLFTECNTYLNLFERTNQSNPAKVIPSEALQETLHSPHNTQKKSKVLNPIPKMSKSDKQKRNVDRITKAKHLCRNINYADDASYNGTSYNHDDFHI